MSGALPSMVYADGIRKHTNVKFGGYNHNLYAGEGELWDMENLTSDLYPLLSPRRPRYHYNHKITKPNGFFAKDRMYWVNGTGFYEDGTRIGTVSDTEKRFAALGDTLIILPDKVYYNSRTGEFGSMESMWTGTVKIQDGTYAGENAEANTIYASGVNWSMYFRVGDAVTITGCAVHPENNKTPIIREIDGSYLRFYENTFLINDSGDTETVTILRSVPDMDFICENENRLWGCKGDTVYASKLGDALNWNVFDGVATDSFAVNVGSAGDFTGCVSFLGYPCFFKEENIYKMYGDKPSNYQLMGSASLGCERGSHASFAVAGEVLFYLSRTGIVAYSGGIPQSISAPFGTERYRNAVAGSDGVKYYVSMENTSGNHILFVYDTEKNLWHKEDELRVIGFGWTGELCFLDEDGYLWMNGNAREIPSNFLTEGVVHSVAEFGDFTEGDPNKKGVSKLQIRCELDANSTLSIRMQYDSDGVWQDVKTLTTTVKRSYYLPIIPRRCDHLRIRLEGTGGWRLYSLTRESYSGSEL